jgi:hypothetical protein
MRLMLQLPKSRLEANAAAKAVTTTRMREKVMHQHQLLLTSAPRVQSSMMSRESDGEKTVTSAAAAVDF